MKDAARIARLESLIESLQIALRRSNAKLKQKEIALAQLNEKMERERLKRGTL